MWLLDSVFYSKCRDGNYEALKLLFEKPVVKYTLMDLIVDRSGDLDRDERYNQDELNCGLIGACEGGHRDIVDFMIEKGAKEWNFGLYSACTGGHVDIVQLMIEKGATDLDEGLEGAFKHNNRAVVELLLEKDGLNLDMGLYAACESGNLDFVNLMIAKGATNWSEGLEGACAGGHRNLVDLMIEKGESDWSTNGTTYAQKAWNKGLDGACAGGHRDLVDLMIEKIEKNVANGDIQSSWNLGLDVACEMDKRDIVDLMICKGATDLNTAIHHYYHSFHGDENKRFIAHLMIRLKNHIQNCIISKYDDHNSVKAYLANQHIIHPQSYYIHQILVKKRNLRNILEKFVCMDVATWSCRFIGMFSPK